MVGLCARNCNDVLIPIAENNNSAYALVRAVRTFFDNSLPLCACAKWAKCTWNRPAPSCKLLPWNGLGRLTTWQSTRLKWAKWIKWITSPRHVDAFHSMNALKAVIKTAKAATWFGGRPWQQDSHFWWFVATRNAKSAVSCQTSGHVATWPASRL